MFEWSNGSIIQLAHAQWDSDIYNYQGAQIGCLGIDEATHFTEEMVRFLRSRVRLGGLKVPKEYIHMFPRILYCSNPGGIGHNYFKLGFVDHGFGLWKAPPSDGGMLRQYVPAKLSDNKALLATDPDYGDRLRGLGDSKLVDAMLDGNWDILLEGIFTDIWEPNIHIKPPFQIPPGWRIDRAHDYGSSAPGGNLYFAESDGSSYTDATGAEITVPAKTLFVYGELYFCDERFEGLRLDPIEQANRMRTYESSMFPGRQIQAGPADASIWTKEPGSDSIADKFSNKGIHFIKSDKSPGSRVVGWQLIRQMLASTVRNDPENPHLYFCSNARHAIRTIPNLQRDKKKVEDVDTLQEDHLGDVLRYRVLKALRSVIVKKIVGF